MAAPKKNQNARKYPEGHRPKRINWGGAQWRQDEQEIVNELKVWMADASWTMKAFWQLYYSTFIGGEINKQRRKDLDTIRGLKKDQKKCK